MRRRHLLAASLLAMPLPFLRSRLARGDERPARLVGLHRRDGWLSVSVGLKDLFAPEDTTRLRSGFVVRVVVRVELYREGGKQPLARQDRESEIIYDLWDERFRLRIVDRKGPVLSDVGTIDEAIAAATTLVRFDVGGLGLMEAGASYRLRLRADLNPLSDDLVQDVRRWLVRAPGSGRTTGDSVFGSFVSFFVNPRIEDSERQISFWSQAFPGIPPGGGA